MHVRVVRFTGVGAERLESLLARINESEGPPPGVPTTGLRSCSTRVREQRWSSSTSQRRMICARVRRFDAMDASETPGTRASVEMCEMKLELEAP
jgi:hypothetical protein